MNHTQNNQPLHSPVDTQGGFTMIEVLITVLIVAIGSLGIASLQIAGLKYTSGAYGRSQAVYLADDMANRLRANREQALDLQADGSYGPNSDYVIGAFSNTYATTDDCINAACTPQELTEFDKQEWLDNVARVLPLGMGQVTFNDLINASGVTERIYSIAIQWRQTANSTDPDGDENDEIKSFTFRVAI